MDISYSYQQFRTYTSMCFIRLLLYIYFTISSVFRRSMTYTALMHRKLYTALRIMNGQFTNEHIFFQFALSLSLSPVASVVT